MFVVEVEVIKQWTDRGNNPWVTVGIPAEQDAEDGGTLTEVEIAPKDLIQVKRSMFLIRDDE